MGQVILHSDSVTYGGHMKYKKSHIAYKINYTPSCQNYLPRYTAAHHVFYDHL